MSALATFEQDMAWRCAGYPDELSDIEWCHDWIARRFAPGEHNAQMHQVVKVVSRVRPAAPLRRVLIRFREWMILSPEGLRDWMRREGYAP